MELLPNKAFSHQLNDDLKRGAYKRGCVTGYHSLTLSQTIPGFYMSAVHVFRKHCGKRRNCSLRAIFRFPAVFSTHLESFLPFLSNLKLSSANSFSLEESKTCRLGKG